MSDICQLVEKYFRINFVLKVFNYNVYSIFLRLSFMVLMELCMFLIQAEDLSNFRQVCTEVYATMGTQQSQVAPANPQPQMAAPHPLPPALGPILPPVLPVPNPLNQAQGLQPQMAGIAQPVVQNPAAPPQHPVAAPEPQVNRPPNPPDRSQEAQASAIGKVDPSAPHSVKDIISMYLKLQLPATAAEVRAQLARSGWLGSEELLRRAYLWAQKFGAALPDTESQAEMLERLCTYLAL